MTQLRLSLIVIWIAACGGNDEAGIDAANGDAPGGDGPSADGSPGGICGGFAGATCDADEYCDYDSNDCGATDGIGTCRPRPTGCPDPVFQPTCACDGQLYGQPCEAYLAGSDLNNGGGCTIEAGNFACGWTQCTIASTYCRHVISDVVNQPDEYDCLDLPNCPGPTGGCACLAAQPCGTMCSGTDQTGLTLTCPGG